MGQGQGGADRKAELSAIIVAFNSADIIGETIEHLNEVAQGLNLEIIVVDNASTDNTYEIASYAIRSGHVIRSTTNRGFGGGVNLGLRAAQGQFVMIMNDDIRPQPGCIDQLLEVARDQSVGLVGPRIISPDGSLTFATRQYLPGPRDEVARVFDLIRRRDSRTRYPEGQTPIDVGLLICACVVGRTELLRALGGFNDLFFMYGEDIDLCRRLISLNLRLATVPTATAVHDRDTVESRRYHDREFSERILKARDTYYRIWLQRPVRSLLNLWRAFGPTDQPYRVTFHLPKVIWDGPSLAHKRQLPPLTKQSEPGGSEDPSS